MEQQPSTTISNSLFFLLLLSYVLTLLLWGEPVKFSAVVGFFIVGFFFMYFMYLRGAEQEGNGGSNELLQPMELGCDPRDRCRSNGILTVLPPSPGDDLPYYDIPQRAPKSPHPSGGALAKKKLRAYATKE